MLIVIAIMIIGVICGYLLRHYRLKSISRIINVLIWALLFLLGLEVGRDERVVNGLLSLGTDAIVITCFSTIGSCVAAWLLWKWSKA